MCTHELWWSRGTGPQLSRQDTAPLSAATQGWNAERAPFLQPHFHSHEIIAMASSDWRSSLAFSARLAAVTKMQVTLRT